MKIIGIETSCDETAVSVLDSERGILSNVVSSQIKDHKNFGGVIPELAARKHMVNLPIVYEKALTQAKVDSKDIDVVAVTKVPGLIGALLVGVNFAKGIAYSLNKPIVPVNHLNAHVFSVFLNEETSKDLKFPFLSLVVSGGHTNLYVVEDYHRLKLYGQTLDDAVGEAFDKVAKLFDLGYPGGPIVEKLARGANPKTFNIPKIMKGNSGRNFSFSGLKTAIIYLKRNLKRDLNETEIKDLCAGFQASATELLIRRSLEAANETGIKQITVVGGVSCNGYLRSQFKEVADKNDLSVFFPDPINSTDNAAMVAYLGEKLFQKNPDSFNNYSFEAVSTNRAGEGY